jgi:hypothetical protein
MIPSLKSGMNDHEDALKLMVPQCVLADEFLDQNSRVVSKAIPPSARSSIHRTWNLSLQNVRVVPVC